MTANLLPPTTTTTQISSNKSEEAGILPVTVGIWAKTFTCTGQINIYLSPGTEGVLKIQSELQIYDDKAVLTLAFPTPTPHPPLPTAIDWCMENKSAHLTEAAHFPLQLRRKRHSRLLYHKRTQFSFYLSEILKTQQRDRCRMQRHRREPISMTQPALSSVSTKLRAHLLPVGHRQKPTAFTDPASSSVNQKPFTQIQAKRNK